MNINFQVIAELRLGLTGEALAEHELRAIARYIAGSCYATASPADRNAFEAGMLRAALRKVCNLLAEAVEDPEPTPDMSDVFAAESAQDWAVTARREGVTA